MKQFIICLSILSLVLVTSCQKDEDVVISGSPQEFDGEIAREWFKLECTIVKETPGFFPPQAARAFGYTGITLYESLVQGWQGAPSLAGQINGLQSSMLPIADVQAHEYNWGLVANAALAEIIEKMFERTITPQNRAAIAALENKWKAYYAADVSVDVQERSIAFGNAMALAIFEYSKNDGGHESYLAPFQTPYTWPTNNGAWVVTGPPNPLSPYWANNRPFITANVVECQPEDHIPYSTVPGSDFHNAAMEVYNVVQNATPEQIEIAQFWADDPFNTCTPTGHTFNIMVQLLEETDANLTKSAVAFAKLSIAESDAFIACWKTKYDHFLIRPVSYIKQNIDPDFVTIIGTPTFPAYTSGHATEAAAGAQVFINMFTNGDGNYAFTDRTQLQFGFSPRSYTNFEAMALECANSRLYGGIHYDMDNMLGLNMGKEIGKNVSTRINWPTNY